MATPDEREFTCSLCTNSLPWQSMSNDRKSGNPPQSKLPNVSTGGTPSLLTTVMEIFGIGRTVSVAAVAVVCAVVAGAAFFFFQSAPPRTITITTGPEGSIFNTNAWKYAPVLARYGVKLKILASRGSQENLQRLSNPRLRVDAGFVQTGVTNAGMDKLVSLGTILYQPLLVFYHGAPVELLTGFAGKRLAIGQEGSGTRSLALTLLDANGLRTNTTLLDWEPKDAAQGLIEGRVDAVFLMGEDASAAVMRQLLRDPDVHLFSFKQAVAYTRRFSYLSALDLPQGSIDFGQNLPAQDVHLIGPTVELIAREQLNPALSDLLLEAARDVHGRATLLQHKNEFPAPVEHDIRISPYAERFYKSGKSFFYRFLPFWLASLTSRVLVVFLPMIIVMIPTLRSIPHFYKWRIRTRIYRRYRALLIIERELLRAPESAPREQLRERLDEIEQAVNRMRVPASFAEQFYNLRGHIDFVRRLVGEGAHSPAAVVQER